MDDRFCLVVEDSEEFRVPMAQGGDGDAGSEVGISSVLEVPDVAALGFGEDGRRADVGCYHVRRVGGDEGCGGRVGSRVGGVEEGFGLGGRS